jgi:proline-rich protein PRCC
MAPHPSLMFMVQPGCSTTPAEAAGWAVADDASALYEQDGGAGGAQAPDALLARALEAERAAAARRNPYGAAARAPPQVLEVSAAQLTAGRDRLVATKSLTGLAFGADHEAKLRAEAGAKPADIQRRKHQIGALLYDAKQREIQMMEGRLQGMKSKRETQAKYGW